jgi:hypothetical protein
MKRQQSVSVVRSMVVVAVLTLGASAAWSRSPQISEAQLAAMQPLDPPALPTFGNFWLLVGPDPDQPWPPLPAPPNDLPEGTPIYDLGDGRYLIDDSAVNWEELRQEREMDAALRSLEIEYGLAKPLETEAGGGMFQLMEESSYPSNSLWLSVWQPTNDVAPVTLNGTVPDVTYEVFSVEGLMGTGWLSEGSVTGTAEQDWTDTAITVGSRTNSLFLWACSPASDSALPIWWQLQFFGQSGVDPNADPDGDGWSNIQEHQNGTGPTVADQPFKVCITRPGSNSIIP